MGGACSIEGEERHMGRVLTGKTEGKRLKDLRVDGRILNGFLK